MTAIGRPQPPGPSKGDVWAFVIGTVLLLAVYVAWQERVYGDWTCAFSHCTRVKP